MIRRVKTSVQLVLLIFLVLLCLTLQKLLWWKRPWQWSRLNPLRSLHRL